MFTALILFLALSTRVSAIPVPSSPVQTTRLGSRPIEPPRTGDDPRSLIFPLYGTSYDYNSLAPERRGILEIEATVHGNANGVRGRGLLDAPWDVNPTTGHGFFDVEERSFPPPKGKNVVIEKTFGAPTLTNDGVSISKEVGLPVKKVGSTQDQTPKKSRRGFESPGGRLDKENPGLRRA